MSAFLDYLNSKEKEFWLNRWIENYHENKPPPRAACYVEGGKLLIYIYGGNHVIYDPEKHAIFPQKPKSIHSFDLSSHDIAKINISLCQKVYQKLAKTDQKTEDELLKEKYRISSTRTLTEKQKKEIAKYEHSKTGDWKKITHREAERRKRKPNRSA